MSFHQLEERFWKIMQVDGLADKTGYQKGGTEIMLMLMAMININRIMI